MRHIKNLKTKIGLGIILIIIIVTVIIITIKPVNEKLLYHVNKYYKTVKINHNYGFFSCCSLKLEAISRYINEEKDIPKIVDSSNQFEWYKTENDKKTNRDITYDYFEHYDNIHLDIKDKIDYGNGYQFKDYSTIDYGNICPLIKKYFSPSIKIREIVNTIENKYNIEYKNTCVLFYRGNDKATETTLSNYTDYFNYADSILKNNPNILFLIQSDETEFIEYMTNKFPNNSFYFKDEIRHMNKCNDTVDKKMSYDNYNFSKKYLAITIIMSKCKYIICGSGNCSIWIMFYRGHSNNTIQYLNGKWYTNYK